MSKHSSKSKVRRKVVRNTTASMPPPEKKRPISAFYTSYRPPPSTFVTKSNVPQKRSSPTPVDEAERILFQFTQPTIPKTPSKHRVHKHPTTPRRPSHSPVTPRSGTLPFRSPGPNSAVHSSSYFVKQTFGSGKRQPHQKLTAQSPPQKKQSTLRFDDIPKSVQKDQPKHVPDDLPKHTQSVLKDGKIVAVRDSDEDDSSSLASLDELFGWKKRDGDDTELSSPPDVDDDARERDRLDTLRLFTSKKPQRPGFDRIRSVYAKQREHKFDISNLLNDHFDAAEDEESVQMSRDRYELAKAKLQSTRNVEVHKDLLGSLITGAGGDEDDMARVLGAVSRTEALSTEKSFSFIGISGLTDWDQQEQSDADFPDDAIPFKLWSRTDEEARSRAYLSGYVSELAARGKMDDAAMDWTLEAAITERDDYLRHAYIECLKRGSSFWTRTNLTAEDVQDCFLSLGVCDDNFKSGHEIRSSRQPIRGIDKIPKFKWLLSILYVFQTLCHDMDFLALATLTSTVCRLALDTHLMSYSNVCSQVESLLGTLLDLSEKETRTYVADHILADMGKCLQDPILQAGLISHLMPTSETAAQLRLRLSHAFLLGPDTVPASFNDHFSTSIARLFKHVSTSPDFDLLRPTQFDYTALRARTHILDAAIADGNTPVFSTTTTTSTESTFNKSVDSLAEAIKKIHVRIADAGASHLSRTEAKDALHALHYRLLFGVRTRQQPKKNIFDSDAGKVRDGDEYREEGRKKDFMKNYLAKAKKIKKEKEQTPGLDSQMSISTSESSEGKGSIRKQLGMN